MNVVLITIWALMRRFATLAGSAILTFVIESMVGWAQGAFLANPKTAAVWPLVYFIIEGLQKAWRVAQAKKAAALLVAITLTPSKP